ncbi:variable surface protein [Plasmodium gonderi]|uniref:Variable surface protein n=1 Tax=Plasmodium gonderi TaxID=77519 RepID=A0A1Y1JNC9_PLAGO|nr:variable surface protein [Plasmodium gonderi]GAW83971.1 variable surface protein [Plasmodium gonderi]
MIFCIKNKIINIYFEFNGIFPQCKEEYSKAQSTYPFEGIYHDLNSHIYRSCQEFTKNDSQNYNCNLSGFVIQCMYLGRYLYHIHNKSNMEKKKNCIYFRYLLKKHLRDYKCKNIETIEANFNKINMSNGNKFFLPDVQNVYNICNEYTEFSDEIFVTLQKLENMIIEFEKFRRYDNPQSITEALSHAADFMTMLQDFLKIDYGAQNRSLIDIYQKYSGQYNEIMNRITQYEDAKKKIKAPTLHNTTEIVSMVDTIPKIVTTEEFKNENTKKFTSESTHSSTETSTELHLVNMTKKSTDLATGTGVGIVVLMFALSLVIFILYKVIYKFNFVYCTPYSPALKRCVWNLKRMENKRSIEHFDPMDSVEMEYKNFVDNKYSIAYSSVEYPRFRNNNNL